MRQGRSLENRLQSNPNSQQSEWPDTPEVRCTPHFFFLTHSLVPKQMKQIENSAEESLLEQAATKPLDIEPAIVWTDRVPSANADSLPLRLDDTSIEILSLVNRRRELMQQTAVIVALAVALLELITYKSLTVCGFDAAILVSGFLFLGSATFCLRFIQIHAGMVFNGLRFSVIENYVAKSEAHQTLPERQKPNPNGVSMQLCYVFALITSLSGGVFISHWYDVGPGIIAGGVFGLLLILRFHAVHARISDGVCDRLRDVATTQEEKKLPVLGNATQLRTHCYLSIGQSHSDMIGITAMLASITLANVASATTGMPANEGNNVSLAHIGAILFGSTAVGIAIVTARIYWRLRDNITKACVLLKISTAAPYEKSISDIYLGYVVLSAFLAVNIAALGYAFYLLPNTSFLPYRGLVVGGIGLVSLLVSLIWYRWSERRYRINLEFSTATRP